jgi:hypothetical protein
VCLPLLSINIVFICSQVVAGDRSEAEGVVPYLHLCLPTWYVGWWWVMVGVMSVYFPVSNQYLIKLVKNQN